jgi:hypothetical protein
MPCLAAPRLPTPDAAIAVLLPTLNLSVPPVGVSFCCTFETPPIPGFPIILPLGAVLALLGAAGDAILATIASVIDLLNSLLDQIPPVNCPLD